MLIRCLLLDWHTVIPRRTGPEGEPEVTLTFSLNPKDNIVILIILYYILVLGQRKRCSSTVALVLCFVVIIRNCNFQRDVICMFKQYYSYDILRYFLRN